LCVPCSNYHVLSLAVRRGIFAHDLSLTAFGQLFYFDNPQIVANKKARWERFLRAAANGRLLERPAVPPLWQPHKEYQPLRCQTASSQDMRTWSMSSRS